MSYVTNLILYIGIGNDVDEKIKEVNKYFEDNGTGFVSVEDESLPDGWYGGTKYLECDLFIGAFNYVNLNGLIRHLKTIKWNHVVQLMILDENEEKFRIEDIF